MKNIKSLLAGSLVAVSIITAPLVSFADNNTARHTNIREEGKNEKTEHRKNIFNSVGIKLSALFGGNRVHADASTTIVQNGTPSISGIKSPTVLKTGETGTWTVKASDPKNGSLEYAVDWGDNRFMKSLAGTEIFTQQTTFTHAYMTPGTYTVTFGVRNEANLQTYSSVTVHVIGESLAAPVITGEQTTATSPTSAVVTWKTDIQATSDVWYGTTSPLDTSVAPQITRSHKNTDHKITLTKLQPDTLYYIILGSTTKGGTTYSPQLTVTTPADTNDVSPVITGLTGKTSIYTDETATITVNAYDPKNGSLEYSADWGDTQALKALAVMEQPFTQSAVFNHMYSAPGTYTAHFTVMNDTGKSASLPITITVADRPADTTAPVISTIGTNVGSATATVAWTTDEPSTSKVFFSTTTPVDTSTTASSVVVDSSLVTDHAVGLSGLLPKTLYNFIVQSADASGNVSTSAQGTFTTGDAPSRKMSS